MCPAIPWYLPQRSFTSPRSGRRDGKSIPRLGTAPAGDRAARRCERFTEKPDRKTAERLVADGRYYWNSGIFLWSAATILKAMARHLPDHWACLEAIRDVLGTPEEVDKEVKERIAVAGPGGGYIVTSANSLTDYCKTENVWAIAKAVKKYGKYPLDMRWNR